MQADSTIPANAAGAASDVVTERAFGWRDIFVSLIVLPVTILAIAIPILYLRMEAPQKAEISPSEYGFVLKIYRARPESRYLIAKAMADGKITRKEFDRILDRIDIKPDTPVAPRPQAQLKQI